MENCQNCMSTNLHEGTKLQEDILHQGLVLNKLRFCKEGHFSKKVKKILTEDKVRGSIESKKKNIVK